MTQHPLTIAGILGEQDPADSLTIAGILGPPRDPLAESRQAFAALDPLQQFDQRQFPEGGVRGGAEGILPTLEAAFPTEDELAQARARSGGAESPLPGFAGAVGGGFVKGVRNVLAPAAAGALESIEDIIPGESPVGGFAQDIRGTLGRQQQAEAAVRPDVPLAAELTSGLAQFGGEVAATPGVGSLLALRGPQAATVGGRVARGALEEALKFAGAEQLISLAEEEPLAEGAKRGQFGFLAGLTIGGILKGGKEVIRGVTGRAAEKAAEAQAVDRFAREQLRPERSQLVEVEPRVSEKPPQISDTPPRAEAPEVVAPEELVTRAELDVAGKGFGRPEFRDVPLGEAPRIPEHPVRIDPETGQPRGMGRPPEDVLSVEPTKAAQPGGFVDISGVGTGIRKFVRRQFTKEGDFPTEVFQRLVRRDGGIGVAEKEISFAIRDFQKAKRQVYGLRGDIPEQDLVLLDRALKGEIPTEQVPEAFREIIPRLRNEIDALSRRLIDSGAIEGDLTASIVEQNIGSYATRSYRVFDDPNWARVVSEDVRNKAKAFIRQEFPELTEEQVAGKIESLLFEAQESGSPFALLSRSEGPFKDLSILKRRKEIPPEIRALYGEFTDPRVNYARSVTKMTHLIENQHFLADVRQNGLGRYFFEEPVTSEAGNFVAAIKPPQGRSATPLSGLHTTPEIARALEELAAPDAVPDFLRHYMKVNGAVKFSKTVLSHMTHVRNVIANTGFAVAQGHWRVLKSVDALRAIATNAGLTDFLVRPGLVKPESITAWRDYLLKLQRLKVIDESVQAGELGDVLADAIKGGINDPGRAFPVRVVSRGLKVAQAAYRAEDDVWKIFAFENEMARYGNALRPHGVPEAEIEQIAANIVRDTYPTYSNVPRFIKKLRRFPLTGTFVAFPWEVGRVTYNSMKLMSKELADPRLRAIGAQRLVGLMTAASAVPAATTASRFISGVTKQEDEDLRHSLPPWSENGDLLHLGRTPDGKFRIIDLSYTDPHSYIRGPLRAFLRGEDWEDKIWEAVVEAGTPFFGEEILAGSLFDVVRNAKKPSGAPVRNPQDHPLQQAEDVLEHLWKALEPGSVTSAKRLAMGISGRETIYGRSYDPKVEALAQFTGYRVMDVDIAQSLQFRVGRFNREQADAMQILRGVATRRGAVSDEELQQATASAERARQQNFEDMHEVVQAAERLGISLERIRRILRGSLTVQQTSDLLNGTYRPFRPTGRFLGGLDVGPEERRRRRELIRGR